MVDISNWAEKNTSSVTDDSGSNPTGIQKVQPVKVTWGNSSTGSGSGDAEFSDSITVDQLQDLVVTKSDESTVRAYQVQSFDTTNNVAWLWVYGSWDRDNSDQIVIAAGDNGDGTEYQWNGTYRDTGTGSNPWNQTGINAEGVYLLVESSGSALDSSPNSYDSDSTTGTTYQATGQIGDARKFDGNDDKIDWSSVPANIPTSGESRSLIYWENFTSKPSTDGDNYHSVNWGTKNNNEAWGEFGKSSDDHHYLYIHGNDINSNTDIASGTWYNIASFYDGSSSVEMFRDTTSIASGSNSNINTGTTNMRFGQKIDSAGTYFPGTLDAIRIYSDDKRNTTGWLQSEYDASPKGGQDFFSWSGPTSTSSATTYNAQESFSVAETKDFVKDLFRIYDGSVSIDDADIKQFETTLDTEDLTTDETKTELVKKALNEDVTVAETFTSNFGTLTGQITLNSNGVAGAKVYAVESKDLTFIGSARTDSNGDYSIESVRKGLNRTVQTFDSFEDGDFSSGPQWTRVDNTGTAQIQSSFTVEGAEAVEVAGEKLSHDRGTSDSLNDGDIYQTWYRGTNATVDTTDTYILTASRGALDAVDHVQIRREDNIEIDSNNDTGKELLAAADTDTDTWYRFEIEFDETNDEATGRVYRKDGELLGEATVSIGTYTSLQYVEMWSSSSENPSYWDNVSYDATSTEEGGKNIILVATDYTDDATLYGEEKSVNFR